MKEFKIFKINAINKSNKEGLVNISFEYNNDSFTVERKLSSRSSKKYGSKY